MVAEESSPKAFAASGPFAATCAAVSQPEGWSLPTANANASTAVPCAA